MDIENSTLEQAVFRIGRELARGSAGLSPTLFDRRWWSNSLLDWCMKDEAFKVRLFRFIDVLPSLRDDAHIAALLEEYFGDAGASAGSLHWGLGAVSATKLGARLGAKAMRQRILHMAEIFIAGDSPRNALPILSRLWKERRSMSVDLLGEATVSEREADHYRDRCLEALHVLVRAAASWPADPLLERDHLGPLPRVNLSVKLSALYSQLDPIDPEGAYRAVASRLRPVLDAAQSLPAAITFDMEQAELKDLTLTIFMRLLSEEPYRSYPYGGIALQAYLKDSTADLERLLRWAERRGAPIGIRLVKGAYWDSEMIRYRQRGWPPPVFASKAETDANYETLTRTMVRHAGFIRAAFGTHNLRSLAHAEAAAQAAGLGSDAYEFQMIFGMAEPLQAAVVQMGRRVRLYTPVGELIPGMAYLVRRLLENTSNESFLRKEYSDSVPLDALLAPPIPSNGFHGKKGRDDNASSSTRFINEPHTDFSIEAARTAMSNAVSAVKAELGRAFPYSRPFRASSSQREQTVVDPSEPSRIVGRLRLYDPADVPQAVQHALEGYERWSARSPIDRAERLAKAAGIMRARRFTLAAWEIYETGKPWREADADVAEAVDFLEFYAREMRRLAVPRRLGREPGELNQLFYAPRGVAAVIAPWNFPLAIPTGMVSAALVTGNTVLFKPSERSSILGILLTDILLEAGIPDTALQVLPGGPDVGRTLVAHPDVGVIAFTGSKEVGLRLLAESSQVRPDQRTVKRVIAEMGGKNAIIIDETADLDEAVAGVVSSFTGYQGQKCSACSRAIVHESIYDLFLQRLSDAVMSVTIGPPEDPAHRMGPMIDERARAKVQEYIEIGTREGRLVLAREVQGAGYFIGPAVFADIQPHHRLAREEIFGPVLAVMKAKDFQDAIRMANDSQYALTGGVYSRSPANIEMAARQFDVGNLYINRPITGALVGRQPFGGHRLSGIGAKAGGEDYLTQFMVPRVVSENTLRRGFAPIEETSGE